MERETPPVPAVLTLTVLALAALFAVRDRHGLAPGPLFGFELRRVPARTPAFAARVGLGLVLLALLALAYVLAAAPGLEPNPWILWTGGPLESRKAQWVPLGLAAGAVFLQLMALGSRHGRVTQSAILEERERRILPFLLTTDLTDREIVFGRPVGRLVAGLLTGLVALPVVAWLLGAGIDARLFLVGYGLLGTMVVSGFVMGLWAAVCSPNAPQAQRRAALVVSVLYVSPIPLSVLLRWPAAAAWPGPPPFTLANLTDVLTAGNPLALMMRVQF